MGVPDVKLVFRSGDGAAAVQCVIGQVKTHPKHHGAPPRVGESVSAGTKIGRLIDLFMAWNIR